MQPIVILSIVATWTILLMLLGSRFGKLMVINVLIYCSKAVLNGSLQVTQANVPAKCLTISYIVSKNTSGEGSKIKSFKPITLVVLIDMATDREITTETIALIAKFTA